MKSRLILNLFLLILVLSLVWFGYFKEEQQRQQDNSSQISQIDANQIQQIIIQKSDKEIRFNKQAENWYISQPLAAKASQSRVAILLSLLNSHVYRQIQTNEPSYLTRFGLDKPTVQIRFDQHRFALGEVEPISKHRYILFNNSIYLVDDTVMSILRTNAESYIDNHLLANTAKLTRLELPTINQQGELTGQTIQIQLNDGRWQTDNASLASDALVQLVDNWQYAQAMQVKQAKLDIAADMGIIRLWFADQTDPVEFNYAVHAPHLLIQHADLHYIFPENNMAELFPVIE